MSIKVFFFKYNMYCTLALGAFNQELLFSIYLIGLDHGKQKF